MRKGADVMLKNNVYDIEKTSVSSTEDLVLTTPDGMQRSIRHKTALQVSLCNKTTDAYFRAMKKCGASIVFSNVNEDDRLEFLQTHLVL